MRATAFDDRLEAIAGKPRLLVTAPAGWNNHPGGTMLAVGRYVYSEQTPRQMLVYQSNEAQGYAYVWNNPATWLAGASTANQRGAIGNVWWAYMHTVPGGSASIGTHQIYPSLYTWQSDVIGAAYDRTLTQPEALRVIGWLSRRLATHTHTHTHTVTLVAVLTTGWRHEGGGLRPAVSAGRREPGPAVAVLDGERRGAVPTRRGCGAFARRGFDCDKPLVSCGAAGSAHLGRGMVAARGERLQAALTQFAICGRETDLDWLKWQCDSWPLRRGRLGANVLHSVRCCRKRDEGEHLHSRDLVRVFGIRCAGKQSAEPTGVPHPVGVL